MAEDPDRVEDKFVTKSLNKKDVYSVTLYPLGTPADVTIDARVPAYTNDDTGEFYMPYAKVGQDKSLWPALMEKALAKDYGTYSALHGGLSWFASS